MIHIRVRHALVAVAAGGCVILTAQPSGASEINPVVGKWQLRTDAGGNDVVQPETAKDVNPVVNRTDDVNPVVNQLKVLAGGGGNDTLTGGESDRTGNNTHVADIIQKTSDVNPVVNRAADINPVVGK